MPIVPEERADEKRKRGGKALYLLLVPPLLLVSLLAAALVRPVELQIGPLVVVVLTVRGTTRENGFLTRRVTVGQRLQVKGRGYLATGVGWTGEAVANGHAVCVAGFWGHRH